MSPAPDPHQRALHADLVAALPGDAFVVYDLDPGSLQQHAVAPGLAVAWLSHHPWHAARWITAVARSPEDGTARGAAVGLAARLADAADRAGAPATGVTWPRLARDLVPEGLRPARPDDWDHWFTREPPPPGWASVDAAVVDLDAADPRIPELLAVASPDAPIKPGDPRVVRWAGVADGAQLLAVVAVTAQRSGAAHLNDVATLPEARGGGLARRLCGQVTVDALAEGRPAVTLGMYTANDAARALYTRLGYTCLHSFTSGAL